MLAFYPELKGPETLAPVELRTISKKLESGESLQSAYGQLAKTEQSKLARRVGQENLQHLFYLEALSDQELFSHHALNFGRSLQYHEQVETAGSIYSNLSQQKTLPGSIRKQAQLELNALIGIGDSSRRVEFLGGQFIHQALDHRLIIPMVAGSFVYGVVRAGALARFASVSKVAPGLQTRFFASMAGFFCGGAHLHGARSWSAAISRRGGPALGSRIDECHRYAGIFEGIWFVRSTGTSEVDQSN